MPRFNEPIDWFVDANSIGALNARPDTAVPDFSGYIEVEAAGSDTEFSHIGFSGLLEITGRRTMRFLTRFDSRVLNPSEIEGVGPVGGNPAYVRYRGLAFQVDQVDILGRRRYLRVLASRATQ